MTNEITTTQGMTPEQVALLSRTIAKDATPDELAMFVGMCKRTGLDPFTRQIYFIKANGKVMTQISIDGFRVIAERSGSYAGQDAPAFDELNGKVTRCSVAVYRWHGDTRYQASVGVAYMAEYAKTSGMWAQMPRTMISKVAECIALRKAFPNDLSGLYAPEEMDQAQPPVVQNDVEPPAGRAIATAELVESAPVTASGNPRGTVTDAQLKAIHAVATQLGIDEDKLNARTMELHGVRVSGLSISQASAIIDKLMAVAPPKESPTEEAPADDGMTAEQVAEAMGGTVVPTGSEQMRASMNATRAAIRKENA